MECDPRYAVGIEFELFQDRESLEKTIRKSVRERERERRLRMNT
jgi:hypothetical protein